MPDDPNEEIEIPDWLRQPAEPPSTPGEEAAQPEEAPDLEPAELPDWLAEMRPAAAPVPEEPPSMAEELPPAPLSLEPEAAEEEPLLESLRAQAMEADLEEPKPKRGIIEKLRERLSRRPETGETVEAARPKPQRGLAGALKGLAPWQRLVLALLLFLNVLLLGCMCLVMSGRVVPF